MSEKVKLPDDHIFAAKADQIQKGFKEAIRNELKKHKALGNSIAVYRNGKVVTIPPEEIDV